MADAATHFIYPSALARDAALDAACAVQASGAVWAGAHLTFEQLLVLLARRLPSAGNGARKLVEGAARAAALGRAWAEAAGKDAHEPTRAAVDALDRLIAAWKGAGAPPQAVAKAAEALRMRHARLAERLAFAARVYALYEKALDTEWTDREGRELDILARLAASTPGAVFAPGTRLRVAGFQRLAPVHRAVLQRLRALGCAVSIAPLLDLPRDARPAREEERAPEPLETLARSFGPLLECMAGDPPAAAGSVLRFEAPTPYSEIYEIGRRVRHWMEREGVVPARIGVAFRDLGPYSQFVADVFGRLNIPMYERRGEPAAFQPLVRAALTALDAARAGLQREELFRFLCSGLADLRPWSEGPEPPEPCQLHEIALAARIDRFFGAEANRPAVAWREKLAAYAASNSKSSHAGAARRAVETVGAVVAELEALRAPRTRKKFAADWRAFFEKAGLLEPAASLPEDQAHARRLAESRAALKDVLDEAAQGPGAALEHVPLERFVELVEAAVAGRSVRLSGLDRAGGVRVLNLYDLRGLRFDRLVIAGMDETRFPAAPAPDALFGAPGGAAVAELRSALEAAAPELRPFAGVEPRLPGEIRDEERALLEIARRAVDPQGLLVLSRSRTAEDGRIVGPSAFWDEFAAAAGALHEAAPVRPAPPLAECLTGEEAELRAAWVLGGGVPADSAETVLAAVAATKPHGSFAGR
ncbi:MAG: hypothetical protein HY291_10160, partial [Planctomycetes bacterium]|nr:hypothetical protein [Planctomycetota bacterium]